MTLTHIVVLGGIVAAFGLFAVVLAWGDYQTRNLPAAANTPQEKAKSTDDLKIAA
jgi:Flp pilus assembly protein CpaB